MDGTCDGGEEKEEDGTMEEGVVTEGVTAKPLADELKEEEGEGKGWSWERRETNRVSECSPA